MTFRNPFTSGGFIFRFWKRTAGLRRYIALDRSVNALVAGGLDSRTAGIANNLFKHWGTPLDQAGESYMRSCLTELETSKGSVLMSGASAMTLVIGAVGSHNDDRNLWCFEQDKHWGQMIRTWLKQYQIRNTFLISAAAVLFQNKVCYRVDTKRVPKNFGLVLCEGTSGTPANPVSTLQQFGDHLSPTFTLLARKVNVEKDGPLMMRWARDHGASFVIINKQDGFVKIYRDAEKKVKPNGPVKFEVADISVSRPAAEQVVQPMVRHAV
jgi:hypothetical protein